MATVALVLAAACASIVQGKSLSSLQAASPHAIESSRHTPRSWHEDPGAGVGPLRVAPELDCAVRGLANDFSSYLLPWADPTLAADALRLHVDCGAAVTRRPSASILAAAPNPVAVTAGAYFVDAVHGDDSAAGTQAAPFKTIARGLVATRTHTPADPAQLVLRNGNYYLPTTGGTIELTQADSGLIISGFPDEPSPVISGGVPLAGLTWTRAPPPPPGPNMTAPVTGSLLCAPPIGCCVDGAGKSNPGICAALAKTPTAAACASLCAGNSTCTGYTWHSNATGAFAEWCYARLDGIVACDGEANHVSGWRPPSTATNLWTATLPASVDVNFDQLFMNGRRLTRARHPNANPEIELSPVGYMSPVAWAPPHTYPSPNETHISGVRPFDVWFPNFQWGTQGTVANFTTGSFWGTRSPPYGDQYHVPSGVTLPADVPSAGAWVTPTDAVVHAFQGGHWGDWAFRVGAANGSALIFSEGGYQEARGGGGQALYVEGVRELLDAVGEWHVDATTRTLTIAFNGSDTHDGSETLVAAQLAELVRVTGSRAAPVVGITLSGLTFAHTLTDFFLPYTVPSGGDWSFHDGGAVRLEGTERVRILSNAFSAPGGNGLQITAHNRATVVRGNHFAWTGASAIVSAGLGGGTPSGGPDFPEGTLIEGNLMREIGVYVKQSGAYYHGVSANVSLLGNVIFNAARAGVNLNDGFAGGHLLAQNLIFNTVRETNDHGAINSWDRQPYAWRPWDAADVSPLPMIETRNFIINNYNGMWSLCHDDGSNGYTDSFNFCPWSGTKNYLGFNKTSLGNYFLYADYSPARLADAALGVGNGWNSCSMSYGTHALPRNLTDVWTANTCICARGASFFNFNGCNGTAPLDGNSPLFSGNVYASDDNAWSMKCGSVTWTSLAEAQAVGVDVGSVHVPVPATDDILAAARALLQF